MAGYADSTDIQIKQEQNKRTQHNIKSRNFVTNATKT